MDNSQPKPGEQIALWNGVAGRAWVDSQESLDRMLRPFEELLSNVIATDAPARLLDVGCGTGGTTVTFARRLGAKSSCTGIDISEPMLAAARARAERERVAATFVLADAQTHAFEPNAFDAIVSRFGVMFFDDPVRAFENLRRAGAPGAVLRFVAWRSASENAFMTTAERAAAPLLPNLPPRRADEPGQFAFGDRDRVARILGQSEWSTIQIEPIDVACSIPESELMPYVTRLGPVGRVFHEADELLRAKLVDSLRTAFAPFVQGAEVRFTSACWMVSARG